MGVDTLVKHKFAGVFNIPSLVKHKFAGVFNIPSLVKHKFAGVFNIPSLFSKWDLATFSDILAQLVSDQPRRITIR